MASGILGGVSAPRVPRIAVLAVVSFWTASAAASLATLYFDRVGAGAPPAWGVVWTKQLAVAAFWTAVSLAAVAWYGGRPVEPGRVAARLPGAAALCVGVAAAYAVCWGLLIVVLSRGRLGFVAGVRLVTALELLWVAFQAAQVIAAANAYHHFTRLALVERERSRLAARLATAELAALRGQLEPHFLFNALNSVASLVRLGRTEQALECTALLGDLLRQVLAVAGEPLVPLRAELDLASLYVALQRVRFGARLEVRIEVSDLPDAAPFPSMVLQPLIENAIKHGPLADAEPCRIAVSVRRDGALTVVEARNRVARRPTADGPGRGLDHLRSRLAAAYGAGHRFDHGRVGDEFVATIAFATTRAA